MLWCILMVLSLVFLPGNGFAAQVASPDTVETVRNGRFSYSVGPEPAWVEGLPLPEVEGEPSPGQAVRYLLEDRQVRIGAFSLEVYRRSVRDLVSPQGVLGESEIQLDFNPDYQRLVLHKVQVARGEEVLDRLVDAEIKLLQREQQIPQGIYTGYLSAIIILKDIRAGDRLEYSYSVEGRNPVFGDKAFGSASVGWGVEVGRVRVRILAPRSQKLRTAAHNTPIPMRKRTVGDAIEYLWQQDRTPVVNDEGDYPFWYTPYPWVEYTEYSGWDEVDRWARQLYPEVESPGAELAALTARLKKESGEEADYVRRALLFVQQEIRYLGMEIGENSHRPHPPEEVLALRYGDCKDKARLLVALLRAGGIKAYPALVSADFRSGVKDFLPSPGVFDHVVVMAKQGRELLWLDGTRTDQRGKLNRLGFVPYGVALVVGYGGKTSLVKVEPLPGQADRMEVTEHFRAADFDGRVDLNVISVTTGGMAEYQRSALGSTPLEELTKNYLNYYVRIYPGVESAGTIEFYDDEVENVVKTVEHYRINDFWRREAEQYLVSDFQAETLKNFTKFPQTLRRSAPLYLGNPVEASHRIVVDFPEDVKLNISSAPLIYRDQASYYESVSRYSGQRFEKVAKYHLSRSWIEAAEVDEHLGNLRRISDALNFSLTVRRPTDSPAERSYRRLLSRLTEIRNSGHLEGGNQ